MSHCHSCGGVIGRDCWNPQECAKITERMAMEARQPDPAPSTTNTAGLEVVAWRSTWTGHTGKVCHALHEDKHESADNAKWMEGVSEHLVTAASAQARIAALEAEVERWKSAHDQAMLNGASDQAADARADRLAGALRCLRDSCIRTPVGAGDGGTFVVSPPTRDALSEATAALQQEPTT